MLALENVGVRYGGVDALRAVSITVETGHVLGLIGPNGAGKTTLINATTGLAPLASGTIILDGRRIDGQPPHDLERRPREDRDRRILWRGAKRSKPEQFRCPSKVALNRQAEACCP